jgi:hypothetical protein
MSKKATEDKLSDLHNLVADTIAAKLRSGDFKPADLMAAIKFLKDNNIECSPEQSQPMQSILDSLNEAAEHIGQA